MKLKLFFFSLLCVLLLLSSGSEAVGETEEQPEIRRMQISSFTIEDLNGRRVNLSDWNGQVVIINFWATWCSPCQQELPFLQSFVERYGEQGFVVLAVSMDGPETQADVRRMVRRNRWTMPILVDREGTLASIINPRGTAPYTLFLDRQHRLAQAHEGYASGDEIRYESIIQALLAELEPTVE